MRELNNDERDVIQSHQKAMQEKYQKDYLSLSDMRRLKDYSITNNINYLKKEYGELYSFLDELTSKASAKLIEDLERIDEQNKFDLILNTLKTNLPEGIKMTTGTTAFVYALDRNNNLRSIKDIFEYMLLDKIEDHEFSELDPEIQDLYFKAQIEIDKEKENE